MVWVVYPCISKHLLLFALNQIIHCFCFLVPHPLQDNAVDDIVIKAMGRAINKTVVIVELLKVELQVHNTTYYFVNDNLL